MSLSKSMRLCMRVNAKLGGARDLPWRAVREERGFGGWQLAVAPESVNVSSSHFLSLIHLLLLLSLTIITILLLLLSCSPI